MTTQNRQKSNAKKALFFPWLTYEIIQERFNISPHTFTGEEDGEVYDRASKVSRIPAGFDERLWKEWLCCRRFCKFAVFSFEGQYIDYNMI